MNKARFPNPATLFYHESSDRIALLPNDPNPQFALRLAPVPEQPSQIAITFGPIVAGRAYIVKYKSNISDAKWTPVSGLNLNERRPI